MRKAKYKAYIKNPNFIAELNKEVERLTSEVKRLEELKEKESSNYQKDKIGDLISDVKVYIGKLAGYKVRVS